MNTKEETFNPRVRMLNKLYSRLRTYCTQESQEDPSASQLALRDEHDPRKIPEDKLYGQISKEDFEKILQVYDSRQSTSSKDKDKPVQCDKVPGKSYAKLLFSRPGFHNMDSTSYLVDDLRIKDTQRDSFLGGHTKYDTNRDDNIANLMRIQQSIMLNNMSKQAQQLMDNKMTKEANQVIKQMGDIDDKNVDYLFTRARYKYETSNTESAVEDFRRALQCRPHDVVLRQWLSDALCNLSKKEYQRMDFKKALDICCEALDHNPDNAAAQMHQSMCRDKIQERIPFAPKPPQARK